MSSESPAPYLVTLLPKVAEKIKILGLIAKSQDISGIFTEELHQIAAELESRPVEWGEPAYMLRHLGMLALRGSTNLLIVHYAVHEVARRVYMHDVQPISGSILDLGI